MQKIKYTLVLIKPKICIYNLSSSQIDSYGKCLNNKPLPDYLEDTSTATGEDRRFMSFVSRYKFHLALENGLCPDYMTAHAPGLCAHLQGLVIGGRLAAEQSFCYPH